MAQSTNAQTEATLSDINFSDDTLSLLLAKNPNYLSAHYMAEEQVIETYISDSNGSASSLGLVGLKALLKEYSEVISRLFRSAAGLSNDPVQSAIQFKIKSPQTSGYVFAQQADEARYYVLMTTTEVNPAEAHYHLSRAILKRSTLEQSSRASSNFS